MSKISVHSKKYYRVVLEKIDRERATIESFTIKLSLRMRTSLPRVKQVARRLPCAIKHSLTVNQANKLKNLLEELGGVVRIESHIVTPGEADSGVQPSSSQATGADAED